MKSALTIERHEGSEQGSFAVNSFLISGEDDAILVDTQYVRSDAVEVVAMIRRSGKRLRAIVTTHSHPDHHLGLQIVSEQFPEAELLATAPVVASIEREGPENIARWKPVLGSNLADEYLVPKPINGDLEIEGDRPPTHNTGRRIRRANAVSAGNVRRLRRPGKAAGTLEGSAGTEDRRVDQCPCAWLSHPTLDH